MTRNQSPPNQSPSERTQRCHRGKVVVGEGGLGGEDPGRETLIVRVTSRAKKTAHD